MSDIKLRNFDSKILYFNGMYKLPIAAYPSILAVAALDGHTQDSHGVILRSRIIDRLQSFKKTLLDEVQEVNDIIDSIKKEVDPDGTNYIGIDILVDLADWLGDIQIYCASEMAKFGIPIKETLDIIMSSNFSKLGADGKPIYDEHGKVLKGPAYWKPEPLLKEMLQDRIKEATTPPEGLVWKSSFTNDDLKIDGRE